MPATLPTGTVTLLFTDIQGSTENWERFPDAMRAALERHDVLLRQAIERQDGYVFKTVGDAFCAAFSTAESGVLAALEAQRAIFAEDWTRFDPAFPAVRVRMGLHTGVAQERGGDYFGRPVNRCARLEAAANGGQVVLSQATQTLVRESLPPGCSLRDCGEHRLKVAPLRPMQEAGKVGAVEQDHVQLRQKAQHLAGDCRGDAAGHVEADGDAPRCCRFETTTLTFSGMLLELVTLSRGISATSLERAAKTLRSLRC